MIYLLLLLVFCAVSQVSTQGIVVKVVLVYTVINDKFLCIMVIFQCISKGMICANLLKGTVYFTW